MTLSPAQVFSLFRGSETQFVPLSPKLGGFEDARGRDDAGDQFGRGHIESGIERAARGVGHAQVFAPSLLRDAPCAEDFRLMPFLNRDVKAALQVPINR